MKKVFLQYDNTKLLDTATHQRLQDISDFYHFPVAGWTFDATTDLHSKLNELADSQVDFVVVSALGNFLRLHSIDDSVLNDCVRENAPLAGHLLDRGSYYCIDPQFFCLNLSAWNQIGRPRFELQLQRTTFTSVTVERSTENFHDGYTPLWIKPGQEQHEYTLDFLDFGTQVLYKFLEHGYRVININQNTRDRKHYLYPDYNKEELVELFTKWERPSEIPLQHFYDKIQYQFDNYDSTVYVLNSEDVLQTQPARIDHYAGVCGGLKAVGILFNQGFHDQTRVSLFDISQPALEYQQYLVATWDGNFDNYLSVFEAFKQQHPGLVYAWRSWNSWDTEVNSFLKSAHMDRAEFQATWQRYKKLSIDFTYVNLLDQTQVTEYFSAFNTPERRDYYIWVSNSFYMEHTIARYGRDWLNASYKNFQQVLRGLTGRVRVESHQGLNRAK